MKVTHVEWHPGNASQPIVLSYQDPSNLTPYNVKGIDGLDPGDILNQRYLGFNNQELNNLSMLKRELGFFVELNPSFMDNEDFSQLRDNLYKMIWTSRRGTLEIRFMNGTTVVATVTGIVSRVETTPFSQTPTVKVTVRCDDPFLKGPDDINVDTDNFNHQRITVYDSVSTAPHGFTFMVEFTAACPSFKIKSTHDTSWQFEVIPVGGFLDNDLLLFSSEFNKRYLTLSRGGLQTQLIDALQPGAIWPILFPGENLFDLEHFDKFDWQLFTHIPAFWGV